VGWYLLIGALLGAGALVLGRRAERSRGARLGLALLVGGWSLIVGMAGVVLAGLWGLTDHVMAYRNENLFQANPISLLLAAAALFLAGSRLNVRRFAGGVALLVAGLSLLGFVLQALPGLDQVNGPIVALALPMHVGVAGALWRRR
jgi:hypothetical protein